MAALRSPPRAIEGGRRVVSCLGRGMGVLGWRGYLGLHQGDATDGKGGGDVIVVAVFLWVGDSFFSAGSGKLAILASQ